MVRVDDSETRPKCWLTQRELDQLERAAGRDGWEREVAIQLMARSGLRASEVNYPGDDELWWSDDGDCWRVEVRGKNTKGGEKTMRDAWLPDDVADDLRKFSRERDLATTDPWIDASTDSIRRWVREAREVLVEETGDERWTLVSAHDLRRSWATYHLVERDVGVRTMMSIG
ncbi:site-specific integrase, partial [Halomarina oriensis]